MDDAPTISTATMSVFILALGGAIGALNIPDSQVHTPQGFLDRVNHRLNNPSETFHRLLIADEQALEALFQTLSELVLGHPTDDPNRKA